MPLSSLEALEWHADDTGLVLRNFDANKHKSRRAKKEFYNTDVRLKFIDTAEQVVGECEQEEKSASIWYVGISQLFFSAIALLYCGGISIAAYLDPGPVDTSGLRRRSSRALGDLVNAVGPSGMLLIGLAITTIMMVSWYVACRNLPVKSIARPVRKAA